MPHQDALISSVTIVVDKRYVDKIDSVVETLKAAGLTVSDIDRDNGVIEGNIECSKVHGLEKLDAVDYCRTVFSYVADYPVGDPRDLDKCEDPDASCEV